MMILVVNGYAGALTAHICLVRLNKTVLAFRWRVSKGGSRESELTQLSCSTLAETWMVVHALDHAMFWIAPLQQRHHVGQRDLWVETVSKERVQTSQLDQPSEQFELACFRRL